MKRTRLLALVLALATSYVGVTHAQMDMSPLAEPPVEDPPPQNPDAAADVFQPYEPIVGAGAACGCGPTDRCGCNTLLFPWIPGPGRCDQWCVGPHWQVEAAGLMVVREDAQWERIDPVVGTAASFQREFDPGLGARIFLTGYNERGYGMQVGYEGVYEWQARAEYPGVGQLRSFDYDSQLHSAEVNFLMDSPTMATWLAGFRFLEVDESLLDFTSVDIPIPPPATPPAAPAAFVENGSEYDVENQLFGFQIGALRNNWRPARPLTIATFAKAGVFVNRFARTDIDRTVTTVISGDDLSTPGTNEFTRTSTQVSTSVEREFTKFAFVGEAGISSVWRITPCLALRGGYQVLVVDGVGQAIDSLFVSNLASDTLLYHGAQFGLEYRR